MEQVVLQCLQFNLVTPTSHTFLIRYLRAVEADETVDWLAHVRSCDTCNSVNQKVDLFGNIYTKTK